VSAERSAVFSREPGACFKCGQFGDFRQEYPARDPLLQQSVEVGSTMPTTEYLRARVGRRACNCLLDTGSDVTLIPASMVAKEDIKGSCHTLSAANGTEIPVLGEVSLPFSISKFEGVLHGLV